MPRLTAATYMGDNTKPILQQLAKHIQATTGLEVLIDTTSPKTSADAVINAANADMLWMCGLLTMDLLAEDATAHEVVAAPIFSGHSGPFYHSVLVTHTEGPSSLAAALGTTLAVNETESWSGYHCLRVHVATSFPGRWFQNEYITGSHQSSINALVNRDCDVAAIDITVWNYVVATNPTAVANLCVIDRTDDWPVPPISLRSNLEPGLRRQVKSALCAISPGNIEGLDRIVPTDSNKYQQMWDEANSS